MGAFLGSSCAETDISARVAVRVALVTRPDFVMAKPGMGVDEAIMLVQNEMARTLAWIQAPLLVDELDRVGPGGHFLDTDETLKHFREFWFPSLLDRSRRPQWLEGGAITLGQRLNARVKEIMKGYRPEPLAPEKKRRVQETLAQAAG